MTAVTTLRGQWAAGQVTLGGWLALPSVISAESVARVGFDYVCADGQHGSVTETTMWQVIQATLLGGSWSVVACGGTRREPSGVPSTPVRKR